MIRFIALPLCLCVLGCSDIDSNDRFDITLPSQDQFRPVGLYLDHRCGSLDCHGSIGRNLRLYGQEGLRLDPTGIPGGGPTTADELTADYRSVVGLEPESMSEVVKHHGKDAGTLTLVEKPLGLQDHKGGTLFSKGSEQYVCITSWLGGTVDMTACSNSVTDTP